MVKQCLPVFSISCFLCCVFLSSFFVNTLLSLSLPRPDQIEILLAFKSEFPFPNCNFSTYSNPKTNSWTKKDVNSFDGVVFDNETGVVTKLELYGACLSGTLNANSSLFRLHYLRYLDLSHNYFDSSSFLVELGRLTNLEFLYLSDMGLVGEVPSSISNLSRLTELSLSDNELTGSFSPLYNLTKLSSLRLSNNHFSGNFPCSLLTMPNLSNIYLRQNHLSDSLETMNCSSSSKLEELSLGYNLFSGRILEPLSKLSNLKNLDLSFQNTTYPLNFVSLAFKSLENLILSGNSISRLNTRWSGSPNLRSLYLDNCNINEFPMFIKDLHKLYILNISNNRLKGEVPEWLWNLPSLLGLHLSHNAFRGSLPIISPGLMFMFASNNSFSGDIPLALCNQSYLSVLDLSHNNFSGSVPSCLGKSVEALNLRYNNLMGRLPDIFNKNGSLRLLDVGHNQITGKLPRSLANCTSLEILNMESNGITDTFPFWLKDLPKLKVIVLRSNRFHGPIYSPQHPLSFPDLRIMDISRNQFSGSLPPNYFVNWSTPLINMPQVDEWEMYMGDNYEYDYQPSIFLRNKGLNMELEKILKTYAVVDFSGNRLQGHIPSSLAKLTQLQSLDLSRNQLSGNIPQELGVLTFLSYMNMSHNKLTGQIPKSTQIGGLPKSSFEGNINLCGLPLQETCFKENVPSTPKTQLPKPPKQEQMLNWRAAAIGYGPGVLLGLAMAKVLASYKPVLFFKLFRL
ncbi:Receptor-like protein 54 [Cardamine amara subsp. amara]|uniref:Receptor-like protein 54 n=1 Tax=Cardamine amara subsp. amara TaxID=228776 RepID=A0ABD1B0K7_CARAN